jgi:hypothetical protein
MPNLRKIVDGIGSLALGFTQQQAQPQYKVRDQAIIRRTVTRSKPHTQEVIVGTITAFADNGKSAVLTIPRPGGVITRTTVPLSQLEPVSKAFKRNSVQWNPALRGSM